jgi:hypothetical protein
VFGGCATLASVAETVDVVQVREILEHAGDHPWKLQDLGVLSIWLDGRRERRLHVWDPAGAVGDPPIHDHPFDFTSTVVVGELVNTRFVEDDRGEEFLRERYVPNHEDDRRADTVRLVGVAETLRAGDRYHQRAHELHTSQQMTGSVTVLHFEQFVDDLPELTVCRRHGTPWLSSRAREATPEEVQRITSAALARFELA